MSGPIIRTHLVLPAEVVKQIDDLVGTRKRSAFIAEAAREKLHAERLRKAIEEGSGVLDMTKHPEWATSEKVVEWVQAQRAIPSAFDKRHGRLSARRKRPD